MPNTPEILIQAKDRFSEITKKAREEFRQLGEEGKKLNTGLAAVGDGGSRAMTSLHGSTRQAHLALHEMGDMIGVHLPRAVTSFLSHTQTIGPALSAAFSTIAVVALIQVLAEIPDAVDKIVGAVTGWDEKGKKAYENQIELNKKYVDLLKEAEQVQIRLAVRAGKLTEAGGVQQSIQSLTADRATQATVIRSLQVEQERRRLRAELTGPGSEGVQLTAEEAALLKPTAASALSGKELADNLKTATDEYKKLDMAVKDLEKVKLPVAEFEDQTKAVEEANKKLKEQARLLAEAEAAWNRHPLTARGHWTFTMSPQEMLNKERLKAEEKQGDELVRAMDAQAQSKKQLDEAMFHGGLDVFKQTREEQDRANKQMEEGNKLIAEGAKKANEARLKQLNEFLTAWRDGAGKVWDAFWTKGASVLQRITDAAKALLNTIGKALFQDLAVGLVGGKAASGGGVAGGIGGFASSLGGGIGQKLGLSSLFGGAGKAGGLMGLLGLGSGGGIAAATTSTVGPLAGIAGGGGALAAGAVAAPAGVGAGLGGMLGLGGGAGLLGLGAATIPVIGGIIAGTVIGLSLLLRHHKDAPFTRDPHEVEKNRSVFFFTGMQEAIDRFTGGVDQFVNKVQTVRPGDVVMAGMPQAFQSSNMFRRKVAGTLLDDM